MKFKPDDDDMLSVREAIRAQTAVHGVYVSILIAIIGRSSEAFWFGCVLAVVSALAFASYSERR